METEKVKEALQKLQNLEEVKETETLVKSNVIIFESNGIKFRLRLPNYEDSLEINNVRRKKKLEMMQDSSYLLKTEWEKLQKNKGIDVDGMKKEIEKTDAEIKTVLMELATKNEPQIVKELELKIDLLKNKRIESSMGLTELSIDCLETQLRVYTDSYTGYLMLERKEGENWIKNFKNYDEFSKCGDSDLLSKLFYYLSNLLYGDVNES